MFNLCVGFGFRQQQLRWRSAVVAVDYMVVVDAVVCVVEGCYMDVAARDWHLASKNAHRKRWPTQT